MLLFLKRVLLVIVSETVEWAIALSETVEWAIAMLVAPLELYCAIVSGYYLSFKLSGRLYFYSAQNCQQETAGNEPAIGVVLHHWRLFFSIPFEFQVIGKVVKDLAMIRDLMRRVSVTVTEIQTSNVAKLSQENVVWLET